MKRSDLFTWPQKSTCTKEEQTVEEILPPLPDCITTWDPPTSSVPGVPASMSNHTRGNTQFALFSIRLLNYIHNTCMCVYMIPKRNLEDWYQYTLKWFTFWWLYTIPLYGLNYNLLSQSHIAGNLGYFQHLAITNDAAMRVTLHRSLPLIVNIAVEKLLEI